MYWIKYSASTHFGFNRQFIVNDSFVRGTIKHTTGHACRFSCLTVYDFSTEDPLHYVSRCFYAKHIGSDNKVSYDK